MIPKFSKFTGCLIKVDNALWKVTCPSKNNGKGKSVDESRGGWSEGSLSEYTLCWGRPSGGTACSQLASTWLASAHAKLLFGILNITCGH